MPRSFNTPLSKADEFDEIIVKIQLLFIQVFLVIV